MSAFRAVALALVTVVGPLSTPLAAPAQSPAPAPPTFTPDEQRARAAVLASEPWQAVHGRFDQWLAEQDSYDETQVAAIKQELQSRIAAMNAEQLTAFIGTMNARLDVLLSPEAVAARKWADQFYTAQGRRQLAAKYGASDPLRMTAAELQDALTRFAEDRREAASAQAAFLQGQAAAIAGANELRKTQAAAAAAAARPATFGTPYAPPRRNPQPQRYSSPYGPVRYSVGPWGGVWVGF